MTKHSFSVRLFLNYLDTLYQQRNNAPAQWLIARALPLSIFLFGLLVCSFTAFTFNTKENERIINDFVSNASEKVIALENSFDRYNELLISVKAFLIARQSISANEFRAFAQASISNIRGIQALEWVPRVDHANLADFQNSARILYPKFHLYELNALNQPISVLPRNEYFPAYYITPLSDNESAIGLDLGAEPSRRTALELARDSGKLIATAPVNLVQGGTDQEGLLIFLPIYGNIMSPETISERQKLLEGFVVGVFFKASIIQQALSPFDTTLNQLSLDNKGPSATTANTSDTTEDSGIVILRDAGPKVTLQKSFSKLGRQWLITASPSQAYLTRNRTNFDIAVFVFGLIITSLITKHVNTLVHQKNLIKKQVAQRTNQLQLINTQLQRNKDALDQFKVTLDNSLDCVLMFDATTLEFLYANQGAVKLLGFFTQEILTMTPIDIIPNVDKYTLQQRLNAFIQESGVSSTFEARFIKKDHSSIVVEVSLQYVPTTPPRFIAVSRDITQRKRNFKLEQGRQRVLEQLATDKPLTEILSSLCQYVQRNWAHCHCVAVLNGNAEKPHKVINDSDSPEIQTSISNYLHRIDRHSSQQTIYDHSNDHACFTQEICTSKQLQQGALIIYVPEQRIYTDEQLQFIGNAAFLAGIAIEKKAAEDNLRLSEEKYRNLVETSHDLIWSVDNEGKWQFVNRRAALAIYGYEPKQMLGRAFTEFQSQNQAKIDTVTFAEVKAGVEHFGYETVHMRKDGTSVLLDFNTVVIRDQDGNVTGVTGTARDVTATKETEKKLRYFASVIENMSEGVLITDANLKILAVNPALIKTTGYTEDELLGNMPSMFQSGNHDSKFYKQLWKKLHSKGRWQGEIWNRRNDGEISTEWLHITCIRNEQNEITHYVGMYSDISAQEHVRKRLHNLAYYDALTKLPNRELFHDRLEMALNQADRDDKKVALMFLDLDRFKTLNDTLGHTIGDNLLKAVAKQLSHCIRDSDTVARLGGDEFTIIVAHIDQTDSVAKVAEKILHSFNDPLRVLHHEFFVSTSIGISIFPNDGRTPETLIKNADTAMYRAKEAGGNNFQFYSKDMSERFSQRLALENELRKALIANQIEVFYQPQIDLSSGNIVGVEALARWKHAKLGFIPPSVFIPIAEETGMITQLGAQVLRISATQAAIWHKEAPDTEFHVAVNLSAYQLRHCDLISLIREILAQTHLDKNILEFELTESALMGNPDSASKTISRLNKIGIQLAIDDFGTGYSSLSYLKQFAINKLKIDRSFVCDVCQDRSGAEIVNAIIAMGHNLNLQIIAEGVENRQQLEFLRQSGCDQIQGFFFSPAVSATEMSRMMKAGKKLAMTG